eukprot:COSAG01_NODE_51617_length_353_cov_1.000000_1_plen_58_part_01
MAIHESWLPPTIPATLPKLHEKPTHLVQLDAELLAQLSSALEKLAPEGVLFVTRKGAA